MPDRPNCYACRYRVATPGDGHSECRTPGASLKRSIAFMTAAAEAPPEAAQIVAEFEAIPDFPAINIGFQAPAVREGRATWPMRFEPKWLVACSGFASPEVPDAV